VPLCAAWRSWITAAHSFKNNAVVRSKQRVAVSAAHNKFTAKKHNDKKARGVTYGIS